ncbi:capsule biosynthesis protein [Aestuariibius insulae]|uniref:capsule biosynthesis protein n=1 Tax=Aestuariibius insulae TaxID=2058287 RepID=UPI00345ECBFB
MTTKAKAQKFSLQASETIASRALQKRGQPTVRVVKRRTDPSGAAAGSALGPTSIEEIQAEGLTAKQLRTARRLAGKNGLNPQSDFEAVRELRLRGIDPFKRSGVLDVVPAGQPQSTEVAKESRVQLPQTMPKGQKNLPSKDLASPQQRTVEIQAIQRDIAKRRRRRLAMLLARMTAFVFLPTIFAGYYFYVLATPMYATHTEFIVTKNQSQGAGGGGGIGGLFQGTGLATQQESVGVQSFLQSREALQQLNDDKGFIAHFSQDWIDPIQRLEPDATFEDAFDVYKKRVEISYDPTEGLLRMEVVAAAPETAIEFADALIDYAEEEVDNLTQRVREDQMAGARQSYEEAELRRSEALAELGRLQSEVQSIDPVGETAALVQQIAQLETQMQTKQLELRGLMDVRRPNQARVDGVQGEIDRIAALIEQLRERATQAGTEGVSQAVKNSELRTAEENYQFRTVMVQQALQQMETARIEADRQSSYLSLNVEPIVPDEPSYPRAFENTILTFLLLIGIYLMTSLTASILREQVTS